MKLEALTSEIYGTLLLASMGTDEDGLTQALRQTGSKEENIGLILKTAQKIIEERDKHKDEITSILTREELTEEESGKKIHEYLTAQGVNELLIDYISTYHTYALIKVATEELVEIARKEGFSEREVKKTMREEMNLDKETTDRMYEAATLSYAHANTKASYAMPQQPKIKKQKPVRTMLLSGITLIIVAYLDYQMEWETDYLGNIAFVLGMILVVSGFFRAID
jgi:DNA-binding phage protein